MSQTKMQPLKIFYALVLACVLFGGVVGGIVFFSDDQEVEVNNLHSQQLDAETSSIESQNKNEGDK